MSRVDLDFAQERFNNAAAHRWPYSTEHAQVLALSAADIPQLLAELRAHRALEEVVRYEHTRNFREPGRPTIKEALATFDRQVGESDDD